jgi:hypothetical protein
VRQGRTIVDDAFSAEFIAKAFSQMETEPAHEDVGELIAGIVLDDRIRSSNGAINQVTCQAVVLSADNRYSPVDILRL